MTARRKPVAAINPDEARDEVIHVMKYMGSKREILKFVTQNIQERFAPGSCMLDMFGGTHSVGYSLKSANQVFGNDIQAYSQVIGQALLCNDQPIDNPDVVLAELEIAFSENRSALDALLGHLIELEDRSLAEDIESAEDLSRYLMDCALFPSPAAIMENGTCGENSTTDPELLNVLRRWFVERRAGSDKFPYSLFTLYFPHSYFGLRQCADLDSLRYAIDKVLPKNSQSTLHHAALTSLVFSASYTTSGTGHFAQYRDLTAPSVANDVFIYRRRSVWQYFATKFNEFARRNFPSPFSNRSWNVDYRVLVGATKPATPEEERAAKDVEQQVDFVYADPPYSFVHYSRFYHALETLVKYDYPDCEFKGRYRSDRHQSDFCVRSKVEQAFTDLIVPLAQQEKGLVISYSQNGMISADKILRIMKANYGSGFSIEVASNNHLHSTMGRRNDKNRQVQELLLIAAPTR